MPLEITYSPALVIASLAVAIMAAFTSLRLTSNLRDLPAARRKARVAQAAFALGGGIWSMHFVGMLAVELPITIAYHPLQTLASALIAVLVTGSALLSLHFGMRTQSKIITAGIVTGLGIVAMHYVGMSAISTNCIVSYSPYGVLIAVGLGIVASIAAMELAYGTRSLIATISGAIVLGLAISAMHYSAMFYTMFSLGPETAAIPTPYLSTDSLALIVAASSFVTCGLFLLSAVPGDDAQRVRDSGTEVSGTAEPGDAQPPGTGRGTASVSLSRASTHKSDIGGGELPARIPYERDKTIRFLAPSAILAAQADGHYTQLLNGREVLFCPWSISRLEEALDRGAFVRTHRSFIVNRNHINGFRRDGDKAYCLVGDDEDLEIPVSRGRIAELRELLDIA
ncbi:MAG: MHYT domain-containing protein [Hyphomicrobiales bacterium]